MRQKAEAIVRSAGEFFPLGHFGRMLCPLPPLWTPLGLIVLQTDILEPVRSRLQLEGGISNTMGSLLRQHAFTTDCYTGNYRYSGCSVEH